jgi:hypothetical protein
MPESATRKKEPHERGPEDVTAPSNSNTLLGKHESSTELDKDYGISLNATPHFRILLNATSHYDVITICDF